MTPTSNIGAASPDPTGKAGAPNLPNLPAWACCIQARHLIDQLETADLYVTGNPLDGEGYRYRAVQSIAYGGAPIAKLIGNLRLMADLYADAISADHPTWKAHMLSAGQYCHPADALLAERRGDGVKVGRAA